MIFLTLGTQLPFDRLVKAVDEVAQSLDETIFGQIGNGRYLPKNFTYVESMSPVDFDKKFKEARVVVGHAGIGTILSGFNSEKPLVLMARRASLGEHRNDHQVATIKQVQKFPGVYVAEAEGDILKYLADPGIKPMQRYSSQSRNDLISNLRAEIFR